MNRIDRRPGRAAVDAIAATVTATIFVVTFVVILAMGYPSRAFAQTFEKFNESARDQLPASPFVAGAYAFIWLALLTYVLVLARGLRSAQKDIQSLKRRVQERTGAELPR